MHFRPALLLLLLCAWAALARAQADDASTSPVLVLRGHESLLRLGFLRPEGESDLTEEQMLGLRDALLADLPLRSAMKEASLDDIGLFPTDGGRDMLRRLNSGEFDLAFIPSRVWAEQQSGYTIILQTRRERDVTSSRDRRVLQRGVIFLSARSPLFDAPDGDPRFADYFARERLAVASSESLAGFIAPRLELFRQFRVLRPAGGLLNCTSSAEAAKAVLSGLVDAGACEEGALDEVLAAAGLDSDAARARVRRVVLRTTYVPTDPVVVRPDFAPQRSALGRELRRALRDFSVSNGLGRVAMQNAQDSDYSEVRLLLREFDDVLEEGQR